MERAPGSIKVLLVEDHELMRHGLKMLLRNHAAFTVVGETNSGFDAVDLVQKLQPDLVLMDLKLAASDGVSSTKQIKQKTPRTLVLALTSFDDRDHVMEAMTAGADGYCLKSIASADLMDAIFTVIGGEPYIDATLAGEIYRSCSAKEGDQKGAKQPQLTPRELEVLRLIMQGATNPQIAKELIVSLETVKTHIKHILEKLSATDRTQAAIEAMKRGLI